MDPSEPRPAGGAPDGETPDDDGALDEGALIGSPVAAAGVRQRVFPTPTDPSVARRHAQMGEVISLIDGLGVRVLLAGNIVFPANGLGSPPVRDAFNLIVDPARCHELLVELGARGWGAARVRWFGLLPPAVFALHERESNTLLNLFPLVPGFFTDPQTVFEHAWSRHGELRIFGRDVPTVDRLLTMVLSVHDNLGPRAAAPKAESQTGALIDRFAALITNDELERLPRLVRGVGGEGVMRRLFAGLGLPPVPTRLPSRHYADLRWGVPGSGITGRLLLRAVETSPGHPGGISRDVWAARRWVLPRATVEIPRIAGLVMRAHRERRHRLREALAATRG